jgi:hypothetical protein
MAEADAASLLQMEAERGFPSDPTTLRLAYSMCPLNDGRQFVTMAGISNTQLSALEQVLAAAKLKPVSFALRLAALQPPADLKSNGVLALSVGEDKVALQITCNGGVVAMRALEGAIEDEGGRRMLHADLVAREARITLGQLPAELRDAVKQVRIFGPRDLAQELADEMELRFEPMGLTVEVVTAYASNEFGVTLPAEASLSAAFSLAARLLARQPPAFEFLPPKPTAWQVINKKYSSGKLRSVGAIAAGVVLIICGLFAYQQFQLMRLNSQWSAMSAKVRELEGLQTQIRKYRPWYDDSFRSLSIFKQLTMSFPDNGDVTAKTVEIRDGALVSCSGNALNNPALLGMLSRLRSAENVSDLKVDSIRGKTPMQFTFDFHWNNGGGREN